MARKRNAIVEAFNRLDDDEDENQISSDELEQEEDEDADEFLDDADDDNLSDEDVEEEISRMDEDRRGAVERSKRKGKLPTRGRRQGRETVAKRAAKARAPAREREVTWAPANTLDAPPPRPGMEQRWIRFQLGDKNDPRNWSRKTRERWSPRRLETVTEDFTPPTLTHGQLGDVIGVGDLILCERPREIGLARKRYFREKTTRQMAAAERRHADKVQRRGNPIKVISKRDISRGIGRRRRASVQSDDE
jgi:hypothetical protein